jgi:16S rRNA G966 N2-methylase RsmD
VVRLQLFLTRFNLTTLVFLDPEYKDQVFADITAFVLRANNPAAKGQSML